MDTSDIIAAAALVVSLMALFVSLSVKFSDFANAPWENLLGFVSGMVVFLVGLYLLSLWRNDSLADFVTNTLSSTWYFSVLPLSISLLVMKGFVIALLIGGLAAMVGTVRDERVRSGRKQPPS